MNYRVKIEKTDTGFCAYSPDVPGVGVAGDTREEVMRLLEEAIAFQSIDDDLLVVTSVARSGHPAMQFVSWGVNATSYTSAPQYSVTANTAGPQAKVPEPA